MAHLALYRAWRPQTFKDMVGQQHIVQTLQNAIRENRLSHAYFLADREEPVRRAQRKF